jgi:hypothetical protein
MTINREKMTVREEDEWLLLSLRERSRKPTIPSHSIMPLTKLKQYAISPFQLIFWRRDVQGGFRAGRAALDDVWSLQRSIEFQQRYQ